ncbi:MAG: 4-hydroxythreonine-4-phosphate dehydrogenase PdxA, partial [Nitrospiraceae bacterium]
MFKADRRPILGLTMGDPAGIGPEVIAKALATDQVTRLCRPLVIGSKPVMQRTVRSLGLPLRVVTIEGHGRPLGHRRELPVLDPLASPLGQFRMGLPMKKTGAASVAFIATAVRLAEAGCISGIVTGP